MSEATPLNAAPPSVLTILAALVDHSLLRPVTPARDEARFVQLETIREYAQERLAESSEEEAIRRLHAASFLALAERAERELTGADQTLWLDRLEIEHDNLRAALAWVVGRDASMALRLVGALWRFWYVRGYLGEGRDWAEAALALDGGSLVERARALYVAGDLAQEQGDYAKARLLLEAGRAAARTAGEPATAALCLNALGFIARDQGAYEEAAAFHDEALALQRTFGDQRAIACTLANLGSLAQNRGEAAQAEALFAEALAAFRGLGDRALSADVAANLAILANQEGDHVRARGLAEEALATYRALGDRQAAATALLALANAVRGDGEQAQAGALYREALDLFRNVDHQPGIASALTHLATLALDTGDSPQALSRLAESLGVLERTGDNPAIAAALLAAARAAGALGWWQDAARLLGATASARAPLGIPALRSEAEMRQRLVSAATAALGPAAYGVAEAAGHALSREGAIAEAVALCRR